MPFMMNSLALGIAILAAGQVGSQSTAGVSQPDSPAVLCHQLLAFDGTSSVASFSVSPAASANVGDWAQSAASANQNATTPTPDASASPIAQPSAPQAAASPQSAD